MEEHLNLTQKVSGSSPDEAANLGGVPTRCRGQIATLIIASSTLAAVSNTTDLNSIEQNTGLLSRGLWVRIPQVRILSIGRFIRPQTRLV